MQIYNTLTKRKEAFQPIDPGHVRMYVCGMTVYDYCHLGHARVFVVFDMIVRYLRARGYKVTYVRNITDIDDKIIRRAQENNESVEQLTARFIQAMHDDIRALGVLPPDAEPRATDHIRQIIEMIEELIAKDYAYKAENGDVYYRVRRFSHYGQLSGKSIEDLQVGARVEPGESKADPLDFALWKAAKPGEPSWPSPWGAGRPGWHIECSAMSTYCLGSHFDVHGGGADLQFPHHENEIAQSEAATGEKFVNLWVHNGFVRIAEEKMSKSLGNVFTIRDALERFDPEVLRYFILGSHYRSPLNYTDEAIEHAKGALTRLYTALQTVPKAEGTATSAYTERFFTAMDDDFNTPAALAVLFELAREINRLREEAAPAARLLPFVQELRSLGGILGLLQREPRAFLQATPAGTLSAEEIEALIAQRNAARQARQWAESDRIRDELKARGVVLEDKPGGVTSWRRA